MKENISTSNKIKIALLICPCWTNLSPPLGMAYLTSMLRSQGHEVKCFDINIWFYNIFKTEKKNYWNYEEYYKWREPFFTHQILPLIRNHIKDKIQDIMEFNPDLVGFTIFSTNSLTSLYVAKEIKRRKLSIKIIFGGPETNKEPLDFEFLNSGDVDAVVIGEGEEALKEIVDKYSDNKEFINIKGAISKINQSQRNSFFRGEIRCLDTIPLPDFRDFCIKDYERAALPVLTSRGCTNRCTFCGETWHWKHFRFRSADNIYRELKQGIELHGVNEFFFNDSLINGNLNELLKLADKIIENKLNIMWGGNVRVHKDMNIEMLKKMKKAGCSYLIYGIESGSQKVLNFMNKQFLLKDAEINLANTAKAGIQAHVNWIVGFPNENGIDFLKSMYFIYKNRKNIYHFNPGHLPCGIPPDSDLAKNPKRFNIVKKQFLNDWRTQYFNNTIIHRKLRLKILRKFISLLKISHS